MKCGPATCLSVPLAPACICCCTTPRQPGRSARGGLGETEDDDAWCGCRLSLRLHARPRAMGARPAVLSLRAPGSGEGKPPRRLAPRSAGCVLVLLRPGLHVAGIPRRVGFGGQRLRGGARLGAHCPAVFSVIRSRRPTAVVYENGVLRANSTLAR